MANGTTTTPDAPPLHQSAPQPGTAPISPDAKRSSVALGIVLFLTMLPVTMMVPVLKELVADRFSVGTFWTHLFMVINMVGAIVTAPFTVKLAERALRRRTILLGGLLLNAAMLGLMPIVTSFYVFMGLRFLEGAFHVLVVSTIMAAASDWAPVGRRGRQMGMIGAALIFGTACGAPLGGRIGQTAPSAVFAIGVVFVLIAAAVTVLFVNEAANRTRSARLSEAAGLLRTRPALLVPYAFSFIDRFCVGVIISTFVLFLADVHGFSPGQRGGLLAMFLFPFAILCYPAGRLADRLGRARLMIFGNVGFGLAFAAYGFVPASWLPVLMLASGVFSAIMFSPNLAICADLAPPEQRAAAYAGFNVAGSLGFLCGPLAGGLIYTLSASHMAAREAYSVVLALAGLAVMACAMAFAPSLLRLGGVSHKSDHAELGVRLAPGSMA